MEVRTLLSVFHVTSGLNAGTGSLREVIQQANLDTTSPHTIVFDPSVTTITLTSALDPITRPVVVNSTNRTDVTIDGGGGSFDGITLAAGSNGSTIQSLNIRDFGGVGVLVQSGGDTIQANTIDAVSTGVRISGAATTGAVVAGNQIGVGGSGATIGVLVDQAGAFSITGNTIGNVFNAGVRILNSTAGGSITGNYVGMTASGTAIGNGDGVQIYQSTDVVIGGAGAGQGNSIGNSSGSAIVIAGASATRNSVLGNDIGFTPGASGSAAPNNYGVSINNAGGNTVGVSGAGNQIDASLLSGVHLFNTPAAGNTVVANLIGARGTAPAAKNAIGVEIISAQGNVIGGATADLVNEIVLAGTAGVLISGATSTNNRILGNLIGTDGTVATNLGNPFGVLILGGTGNTVGGSNAGEANTIGGNTSAGVSFVGGQQNLVARNLYVGANGPVATIPAGDINVASTANGGVLPPVIAKAVITSPLTLTVTFTSSVGVGTTVEVYQVTPTARTYLGTGTVAADFTVPIPAGALHDGDQITATATPTSGTSAFSTIQVIGEHSLNVTNNNPSGVGSLYDAITQANLLPSATITFLLDAAHSTITIGPGTLLPWITKPITFDTSHSPAAVTIAASLGGAFDGFVLAPGSGGTSSTAGSFISDLTLTGFQGAAIRIQTDFNSVDGVTLVGNRVGINVTGDSNQVQNVTVGAPPSGQTNGVGILVDGSSNTISNNIINSYANAGIQIVSGDYNRMESNEFTLGSIDAVGAATAIVVGAGANQEIVPAEQVQATLDGTSLSLRFNMPANPAGSNLQPATIEIYQLDASTGDLFPAQSLSANLSVGVNTVATTLASAPAPGAQFLILVTTQDGSTSAFSSTVLPNPGNVVYTTADDGAGSLRAAIAYVTSLTNSTSVQVYFNIPASEMQGGYWTILLSSPLDPINKPIIINGWRTPSAVIGDDGSISPLIRIMPASGAAGLWNTPSSSVLNFGAGSQGSEVRGLNFTGFAGAAIQIDTSNVKIVGNQFYGSLASPQGVGVLIRGGAGNQIGGYLPTGEAGSIPTSLSRTGNVFGGLAAGVLISGAGASANKVAYNSIGTNGFSFFANIDGVRIVNSSDNQIYLNLIGANEKTGVTITAAPGGTATRNTIAGNNIGAVPYREPQFPSGNGIGVYIDAGASGNILSVYVDPTVGAQWNVIGNNIQIGVQILSAGNTVTGTYLGTDSRGRNLGNGRGEGALYSAAGLNITGPAAEGNTIGGVGANQANVFGWNPIGVLLDGGSRTTTLRNNYIGTSTTGLAVPNDIGLFISNSNANVVGPDLNSKQPSPVVDGLLVGANFISGNSGSGILLVGDSSQNLIRGNLIGKGWANAGGPLRTLFLGNRGDGIEIAGESGGVNTIGGQANPGLPSASPITAGIANLINGNFNGIQIYDGSGVYIGGNQIAQNLLNGIAIVGDMSGSALVATIVGNVIGMNFAGTDNRSATTSNSQTEPTGNGLSGISIGTYSTRRAQTGASAVLILGNLISSNGLDGVEVKIADPVATYAVASYASIPLPENGYAAVAVASNIIGLSISGASGGTDGRTYGNVLDGVGVRNVGGVVVGKKDQTGRANVISGNLGRGVAVYWTSTAAADADHATWIGYNFIGTNLDGTATTSGALTTGNLSDGVFIYGPAWVTVSTNLIAGNRAAGVHAYNQTGDFAGGIQILSNFIGANRKAQAIPEADDFGNGSDGVFLDRIRSSDPTGQRVRVAGNTIDANRGNGVQVYQSSNISITGNTIGDLALIRNPSASSSPVAGNGASGVFVNGSARITIGGELGSGNVISGNRSNGVLIVGNLVNAVGTVTKADGNRVVGNLIGLAYDGASRVGNQDSGIVVITSSFNRIGEFERSDGTSVIAPNFISGNGLYGVLIVGREGGGSFGNEVFGNYVGTTSDGLNRAANSSDGVFVLNARNTSIGGERAMQGNVISGNEGQGVRIFGEWADGNTIQGNLIGLNRLGAAAIHNSANGVILDQISTAAEERPNTIRNNVISGNSQAGIMVTSTLTPPTGPSSPPLAVIAGNIIGLNAAGDDRLPNSGYGVLLFGASRVEIGGTTAGDGNVISGNSLDGVLIYSPSGNAHADGNELLGNLIGTDRNGGDPTNGRSVANQGTGVHLVNALNNQIGPNAARLASSPASRNVISGNLGSGVLVEFQSGREAADASTANRISGNYIGVDATGATPLGNLLYGVALSNTLGTLVGSRDGSSVIPGTLAPTSAGVSNVISGNGQVGVYLTGTTTGTQVLGNYIGVAADGRAYDASGAPRNLNSAQAAVLIDDHAMNNLIGGLPMTATSAVPGTGNIITQNWINAPTSAVVGVMVNSPFATGNQIASNVIGLDANGRSGGNAIGVLLNNARQTTIGGLTGGPRAGGVGPYSSFGNVISGNSDSGVEITGSLAANDRIYGNFIGSDFTGTVQPAPRMEPTTNPLFRPSQSNGVLILQGTGHVIGAAGGGVNLISGNLVGVSIAALQSGGAAPSGNVIEGNVVGTDATGTTALPNYEFGVLLTSSAGNLIRGNLISANGVAGVEILGGRSQAGAATSLANTITGNSIGVNAAGQVAFAVTNGSQTISSITNHPAITLPDGLVVNYGFQSNGVVIIGASDNQVNANTISGNIQVGVYISRIDNLNSTYGVPTGNVVQGNNLGLNGIYGVFRYDAPNGNPADANTFTGTPIPIGDYVTGLNSTASQNQATSILLGGNAGTGGSTTTNRPATPPRRSRPAPLSRPQLAQAARAARSR